MLKKRYFFWNKRTKLLNQVRVFCDYTDGTTNRTSASLEIKDISAGTADSFTIETSDTGNYTWTEGSGQDFIIGDTDRQTAENIASAINSTANFAATAITGKPGNCFVYVNYTATGYLTSAYSGNTSAWAFYEVNDTNKIIRTVYESDGSVKPQPFFSNRDGWIAFYVSDGSGKYDLDVYKDGSPIDPQYYEELTP